MIACRWVTLALLSWCFFEKILRLLKVWNAYDERSWARIFSVWRWCKMVYERACSEKSWIFRASDSQCSTSSTASPALRSSLIGRKKTYGRQNKCKSQNKCTCGITAVKEMLFCALSASGSHNVGASFAPSSPVAHGVVVEVRAKVRLKLISTTFVAVLLSIWLPACSSENWLPVVTTEMLRSGCCGYGFAATLTVLLAKKLDLHAVEKPPFLIGAASIVMLGLSARFFACSRPAQVVLTSCALLWLLQLCRGNHRAVEPVFFIADIISRFCGTFLLVCYCIAWPAVGLVYGVFRSLLKMGNLIACFVREPQHRIWLCDICFVVALLAASVSLLLGHRASSSFFALASLAGWLQVLAYMVAVDGLGPYVLAFCWFFQEDFLHRFIWLFIICLAGFCQAGAWLYRDRGFLPLMRRTINLMRQTLDVGCRRC
eukprot:SAG31_NODE_640_length_13322_cov_4.396703_9_plen_430_part_00